MKPVKEIFESFSTHYDYEEKQGHEMDSVSWNYQDGYLLSNNEMKAITDLHFEMLEALKEAFLRLKAFGYQSPDMIKVIKKAKGE